MFPWNVLGGSKGQGGVEIQFPRSFTLTLAKTFIELTTTQLLGKWTFETKGQFQKLSLHTSCAYEDDSSGCADFRSSVGFFVSVCLVKMSAIEFLSFPVLKVVLPKSRVVVSSIKVLARAKTVKVNESGKVILPSGDDLGTWTGGVRPVPVPRCSLPNSNF